MKWTICSVRDSAAQIFGRPVFVAALGQAVRGFADQVNDPQKDSDLARHPSDFELYELGTFDDVSGEFALVKPRAVSRGKDVATPKE